jgi:tryptophanyl-tRNA synthetase
MSLKDGTKKMSKSDRSEYSKLLLTDSADMIQEKLLRAKTDSIMGVTYDLDNRPEVANLLTIFSVLSGRSINQICQQFADKDMLIFKKALLEILVEKIVPIGKKIEEYQKDKPYMLKILNQGSDKARDIATETLREVKTLMGLV